MLKLKNSLHAYPKFAIIIKTLTRNKNEQIN